MDNLKEHLPEGMDVYLVEVDHPYGLVPSLTVAKSLSDAITVQRDLADQEAEFAGFQPTGLVTLAVDGFENKSEVPSTVAGKWTVADYEDPFGGTLHANIRLDDGRISYINLLDGDVMHYD